MNLGPNHKDTCDGTSWRHSGEGYNRVRVCNCGAEDHDPEPRELIMNFRQWGENYLVERLIWPKDAPVIVQAALDNNEPMKGVADRSIEGYPASMRSTFALLLNQAAIKWIDANCPQAMARMMFDGTGEKLLADEESKS